MPCKTEVESIMNLGTGEYLLVGNVFLFVTASVFNVEHADSFPFEAMTTIPLLTFPKQLCYQMSQKANTEKKGQIWWKIIKMDVKYAILCPTFVAWSSSFVTNLPSYRYFSCHYLKDSGEI